MKKIKAVRDRIVREAVTLNQALTEHRDDLIAQNKAKQAQP